MSIFSSNDVMLGMQKGEIEIDPFNERFLGTNSLDVHLDRTFIYVASVDGETAYFGPLVVAEGEKVWVPAGGTMLGRTIEKIGTHGDVVASMRSRSSTRRRGLTVCLDAGLGDIGYANHWTCEFSAHLNDGVYIKTGLRFAQMTFERTETPPIRTYNGQYNSGDWPLCMVPEEYRGRVHPLWMLDMVDGFRGRKLTR